MCYYGSPHQGGPYQSLTGSCLLLHHLFHSLFCTTDVPMYAAGESVFYRRSDGSLVPATVLFFFRGTGLPTAVRKNQPLVPRSNLGGKVCARTNPWFRGQTLLVLGHGGGGVLT